MNFGLKELIGYTVDCPDGEIGKADDLYFDDFQWAIRYLVVDTGSLLNGKKVLISPEAFERVDRVQKRFYLNIKKEVVESSPEAIQSDLPILRQQEADLHDYYGWPYYWSDALTPGTVPGTYIPASIPVTGPENQPERSEVTDSHLRSTTEVIGHHISARDGEIGRVEDFISNDGNWKILYMIVDTGRWLPGQKVLISPTWIRKVDWTDSKVDVDLKRETIQNSPPYDPSIPLDNQYLERLDTHYGKKQ